MWSSAQPYQSYIRGFPGVVQIQAQLLVEMGGSCSNTNWEQYLFAEITALPLRLCYFKP